MTSKKRKIVGSLFVAALFAGCTTQAVQKPPSKHSSPENVPVTVSRPVPVPAVFLAPYKGRGTCPEGFGTFLVPWVHSAAYDPHIVFIRTPDPVPTCVQLPEGWLAPDKDPVLLERMTTGIKVVATRKR